MAPPWLSSPSHPNTSLILAPKYQGGDSCTGYLVLTHKVKYTAVAKKNLLIVNTLLSLHLNCNNFDLLILILGPCMVSNEALLMLSLFLFN